MIKFKPIKKFLKKFKLLIRIFYNMKYENLLIKTQIKSILSQSGILDAPFAESYLESVFVLFILDFYKLLNNNYNDVSGNLDKLNLKNIVIKEKTLLIHNINMIKINLSELLKFCINKV